MKKIVTALMITLIALYGIGRFSLELEAGSEDWVFDLGQFRDSSYQRVHKVWLEDAIKYQGNPVIF